MNILGINPAYGNSHQLEFWGSHDGGACLLTDGEIVAVAEEERFTREKHAYNTFPHESIEYVLAEAGCGIEDVDVVAIGRDPTRNLRRIKKTPDTGVSTSLRESYETTTEFWEVAAAHEGVHVDVVEEELTDQFDEQVDARFECVSHHRCHAASAAYCAPTERPVLTIDSRGEDDSTVLWSSDLERIEEFSLENSVGKLYSLCSQHLGYRSGRDAGKVMGLSAYGDYRESYAAGFDRLVDVDEYDVTGITAADDPFAVLDEAFCPRRVHPEPFTDAHEDFAWHLQQTTEEIVKTLASRLVEKTGVADIALAGGVGMNCKANQRLVESDIVDHLFIQPAADDRGICLGAALEAHSRVTGDRPDLSFSHVYYGPSYESDEIAQVLAETKTTYETPSDVCRRTAELIADGALVGWFQNRMEYGARALGNRSILADPRTEESLDRVNARVKGRESWRPFAPSLLAEARGEYLVRGDEAPYMIVTDTVRESVRDEIPAVVHTDGTTRPQTVTQSQNARYHRLLSAFESLTGVPVLLNTSFNISGDPIVESPRQALRVFYSTGLDALVMGDHLLVKPGSPHGGD